MQVTTVLALLVLQCTRCLTIRVPVDWTDDSEVNKSDQVLNTDQIEESTPKAIYKDYFQYTGQKPQFAIDVAADHGVETPENHYKAYPVRPHTNLATPVLGQHHILDPKKNKYHPYQKFVQKAESVSFITPASTSFEIYHPYKAEEPYLKQIYNDPVLKNIRNDLRDSKNRLQHYEHDAGQSDVRNKEYLESPHEIDEKKRPQKNVPAHFEIHRPHRRPIYYRPPFSNHHREHFLNNKLRSPWKTNTAKITPAHYRPIKHHLQGLRQQHAIKFDDEQNEYPQELPPENFAEKPNGYDIYEKGKSKYTQIKNNAGEFINNDDNNKRPLNNPNLGPYTYDDSSSDEDDEEEFVPIKNYAQVRKTETTKHLPKGAAVYDAESLEDIENAPRLREAIKSTKAQTVYSEEGYEDGAYDHGGEQKHASEHEGHGGYLKENEISGGKYKAPSLSTSNDEVEASAYRDQILDGKKWADSKKQTDDEAESDDYTEDDEEHTDDIYIDDINDNDENDRHKRNEQTNLGNIQNNTTDESVSSKISLSQDQEVKDNVEESFLEHDVIKRETSLKTTEIPLISQSEDIKQIPKAVNTNANYIKFKYPYYLKKSKTLNKDSPIRYAENIVLIPKKTRGGTEFYDSRAALECPEVESEVDPIPDKLKKGEHPDDNEESNQDETVSDNKNADNKQRLTGLGDKIDCFKVKYFGENPLDSPFFREDKIENPEPIILPNVTDIFHVLEKIHEKNNNLPKMKENRNKSNFNATAISSTPDTTPIQQKRAKLQKDEAEITLASIYRKKRAAPFVYEPYKIIKDSQIQDSKKTTTSGNISPFIKQLQSSKIIDHVSSNQDKNQTDKIILNPKFYNNISKGNRQKYSNNVNDSSKLSFDDVSTKHRRGEPSFEIKPINHKSSYSPVDNKRAMSIKDYEMRTNGHDKQNLETHTQVKPANRYYFDVSQYLPQNLETQNIAASTMVRKVIRTTTSSPSTDVIKKRPLDQTESEEYDEYEDDEEEEIDAKEEITSTSTTTTTTTTTRKPVLRKRIRGTTTTAKAEVDDVTELPKLRLVTRFNSPKSRDIESTENEKSRKRLSHEDENEYEDHNPQYTEMKKKSRTRTLVTDTKVYGDGSEDREKEEVDKLIGVKQDMNDYLPMYEKVRENSNNEKSKIRKKVDHDGSDGDIHRDNSGDENRKEHVADDNSDEVDEEDDDDDDDDDDEEDREEDEDEDEDDNEEEDEDEDAKEDKGKGPDKDDDSGRGTFKNEDTSKFRLRVTTSEPTKRTLARPTEPAITTTVPNRGDNKSRPFQIKKKIEIHKEIPVNRSSPNVTQFKQDVKEIEIIRKTPFKTNKKSNKNLEALDLYRDDNLAKDINKLGGVEIFKENLNLNSEPRHGGNYRSINDEIHKTSTQLLKPSQDVETSESESIKQLKLGGPIPRRRGKHKSNRQGTYLNGDDIRSSKNKELSDSENNSHKSIHAGNPRSSQRRENKNAKFVELVEDQEHEEIEPDMHGGDFKSFGSRHQTSRGHNLHGGNYRSARIVEADKTHVNPAVKEKETTAKAAELLEGFVRAVPILTTTPVYILDPSKRMYYYVDA